jgi:hypothetical protein
MIGKRCQSGLNENKEGKKSICPGFQYAGHFDLVGNN